MNENNHGGHLTADQILRLLVEGTVRERERHLSGCEICKARLAEAQAPLTVFRAAFLGWSEARIVTMPAVIDDRPAGKNRYLGAQLWLPVATVALAAMLLIGFVAGPGWLHGHLAGQSTMIESAASSDSDAALMSQVDSEVSEAVPDALAPLTDLVAWDESETTAAKPSAVEEKKFVHKKAEARPAAKTRLVVTD